MVSVELDIIQTAGVGALALIVGIFLTRRISFLQKFCVPSPVSGGIIFSLLSLALYAWFHVEVSFDGTLKDFFMTAFFTSVGFQSDFKVIKQGGRPLLLMLVLLVLMIAMQNLMATGMTRIMDINPLIGVAAGSVSMTGGHGTAGGFSALLEELGLQGGGTIAMAAATFGLVAGSMIGGPLAERLIRKKVMPNQLSEENESVSAMASGKETAKRAVMHHEEFLQYAEASYIILLTMGGGTLVNWLIVEIGLTVPTYFGAMILAVIVRNAMGLIKYKQHGKVVQADTLLHMDRIVSLGNICLPIFLGMAMISLQLWQLQSLALPLVVILLLQVVMMLLFAYFVAFPMLGRSYDAAVLCAGLCGFGLGATPNAMANMSAVCDKYRYAVKPFLIIPIIGGMCTDLINVGMITFFLNML